MLKVTPMLNILLVNQTVVIFLLPIKKKKKRISKKVLFLLFPMDPSKLKEWYLCFCPKLTNRDSVKPRRTGGNEVSKRPLEEALSFIPSRDSFDR